MLYIIIYYRRRLSLGARRGEIYGDDDTKYRYRRGRGDADKMVYDMGTMTTKNVFDKKKKRRRQTRLLQKRAQQTRETRRRDNNKF
jgi:hypothetical protein